MVEDVAESVSKAAESVSKQTEQIAQSQVFKTVSDVSLNLLSSEMFIMRYSYYEFEYLI